MQLDWSKYPNFGEHEFKCPHTDRADMCPVFMGKLQTLRTGYGKPMTVTSGYRDPDYNDKISSTGKNGVHTLGKAVDIAIDNGMQAHDIVRLAMQLGFTGIGVRRKKDGHDFVHLDTATVVEDGKPRPALWTY